MTRQSNIMALLLKIERELNEAVDMEIIGESEIKELKQFWNTRLIDIERNNVLYPNVWVKLVELKKMLK